MGGWHNPHVQYAPVGYSYEAADYCLECTSKMAHDAIAIAKMLADLIPAGKRAWRNDETREWWFIRGNRLIAKRYSKKGRSISKRVIVHDLRVKWSDCCTECHLDLWARVAGIADRHDEWSFDSNDFPKHIAYHSACQLSCGDVGCEYSGGHSVDCPDDCESHCAVDCPDDCEGESHCNGEHHERCSGCGVDICDV